MSQRIYRTYAAALAAAAALLLAGCGASDVSSGADPQDESTSQATQQSASAQDASTQGASAQDGSAAKTNGDTGPQGSDGKPDQQQGPDGKPDEGDVSLILDAPNLDRGEHRPVLHTGHGDAVIRVRHHPAGAPVRALIVNKDGTPLTAKIRTGSGAEAKTLGTYNGRDHGPVRMNPKANTIDIRADGYWLVKLLPDY